MAEAFGVDAARLKIVVFVYAALLACVSGWLYAHLQRFVNPTPFGINQGIEYLFMAVVGGAGSVWGAVLGATLITLLKQVLQDRADARAARVLEAVLPPASCRRNFELIVFGILIVLLLQCARDGLWPWIARLLPRRRPAPLARRASRCPRARASRVTAAAAASFARARKAVRRPGRGQRPVLRHPPRRDPGPHRSQRRGQEHHVRPDLRRAAAHLGRRAVRAARRSRGAPSVRDRAARHRPHVPAREADSGDERARQRRARRLPARHAPACCARR